ncbi:carph-isopro domain-containing protein [Kaistia dalseonensis]|uniref:carph-isopro domain-containing protein n=1 Tax=Kaistia dalseonensis TaxID=410840 RepID=UPI00352240E3
MPTNCVPLIETVEDVIAALGGNDAAAQLAGLATPSAVSNWPARGRIPASYFLVFQAALAKDGRRVSPTVFGIRTAAQDDPHSGSPE